MNRIIALKRYITGATVVGALVVVGAIAQSYATEPCPLPETATTNNSDKPNGDNSPPGPPNQNQAVLHNGFILCLPPSAADAHIRHGDTPQGPCDKPGRVK